MSEIPPSDAHGDLLSGWPYTPPPQGPQPPPAPPTEPVSGRRWRLATVGVVAIALLSGAVGGVAGQLGSSAVGSSSSSSSSAATATAASAGRTSPSLAPGPALSVGDVISRVEPSVVAVDVTYRSSAGGAGRGAGTGVILTADGEVLTNAHVVDGESSVSVTLNGESRARPASVVGIDTTTDLALVQITGVTGLPAATLGSSAAVRVGDEVVAIGNALALHGGPTVTKGIISGLDRSLSEGSGPLRGLLQTDASISSGNSGGPLIDAAGEVIGINTAVAASSRSTSAENIGFAIAIDGARPVIGALRSGGLPR